MDKQALISIEKTEEDFIALWISQKRSTYTKKAIEELLINSNYFSVNVALKMLSRQPCLICRHLWIE